MADTLKSLAQSNPASNTLTDAYTVPSLTSTTVSSLVVCNKNSVNATFRIAHAVAGAADSTKQYLYYDMALPARQTFVATIGITMATTDVLRVYASTSNLAFNFYGVEVT